jgi:uncharacterized lipoprotein YmbA
LLPGAAVLYAAVLCAAVLCGAACSSGAPRRIYVLTPPIEPAARTTPAPADDSVAPKQLLELRRILIPDYLDSTDILTRRGNDEVKASTTGRWGERLSQGLTHAMAADLAARMPQVGIVQDGSSGARQQLRITINALDLWPDGRCVLAASWSIVDQDNAIPVTNGSGTFDSLDEGGTAAVSDANQVDAVTRTIGKLADRIVPDALADAQADAVAGARATPGRTDPH